MKNYSQGCPASNIKKMLIRNNKNSPKKTINTGPTLTGKSSMKTITPLNSKQLNRDVSKKQRLISRSIE
jgi:hypothetical protein